MLVSTIIFFEDTSYFNLHATSCVKFVKQTSLTRKQYGSDILYFDVNVKIE